MYIKDRFHQFAFSDFNQPLGLKMNPENRWIKRAQMIPWFAIEDRYADLFPSKTGMPAKPLRMALGSLIIQKQYEYSDRELVEQLTENPYYQFFIGLPGYQQEQPFVPSLLVEFRKRLTAEILGEINEMIIEFNDSDDDPSSGDDNDPDSDESVAEDASKDNPNRGTLMIDATCAPQNIRFPQDICLLNEARENLEQLIDSVCYEYNEAKPRTYRQNARKDYLALAKRRKRSGKPLRKAIRKQLQYIRRDLGYIDVYLSEGKELPVQQADRLKVIRKVYEQQKYMYDNKTHKVSDRIVSISQPYIRPIVRGKAKAATEFGVKLDISVDEHGMVRIEKQSFDAYNESDVLIGALENYRKRTGHYPERVLADKIYRNRINLSYCRDRGIRLSGPALGRPKKNPSEDRKITYTDGVDRIEVERAFSLAKRCYGLGLIRTKLETTTRSSVSLSIIAMNIGRLSSVLLCRFLKSVFSKCMELLLMAASSNKNLAITYL